MRPFLKWAGSKKWLVRGGLDIPSGGFDRYIEPFLGSGAVFFDLLPGSSILSDTNRHLVNSYQEMKGNWEEVFGCYKDLFSKHSPDNYYKVRKELGDTGPLAAGQFIYLNRTCFNGIFRVNLAGQFNVPLGSKISDPFDRSDFEAWGAALAQSQIYESDFEQIIDKAGERDFIFVDPPYTVAHNKNGFIEYNEKIFSWDDQIRLANSLMKAQQRGAKFLLTNANHSSVTQLYSPYFQIREVDRRSAIAGDVTKRRPISEIIVSTH